MCLVMMGQSRQFAAATATKKFGPKLDVNDEPRFLEQVKLFFDDAANDTGIDD